MKKLLLVFIAFVLTAGAVSAQQLELKEVITRSARGIEGELPQINFESTAKAFSEYVIEELISELLEAGKITVVDRKNLATIMEEMKFQYSGNVSDESMVSIGKMIGAQYIISGTLTDMKTYYRFRIRIINVQTATIQRQITSELKKDKEVAYLIGGDSAVQEIERQQQETEREQQRIEKKRPTSNVRNNWISGVLSSDLFLDMVGGSIGTRYERMINSKISVGANFFWLLAASDAEIFGSVGSKNIVKQEDLDRGNSFGIEAFFRFYPWGRKFFLGYGIGYYSNIGKKIDIYDFYDSSTNKRSPLGYAVANGSGVGTTLKIGWKLDIGKEGGFFLQPSILGTIIMGGEVDYSNAPKRSGGGVVQSEILGDSYASPGLRINIGVGYAF